MGIIIKKSIISGKMSEMEIDVTLEQLIDFDNGKLGLIQEAFPHLSVQEREFIISGIHPTEWEQLFGNENEEENK
jgi:hypothetical protein